VIRAAGLRRITSLRAGAIVVVGLCVLLHACSRSSDVTENSATKLEASKPDLSGVWQLATRTDRLLTLDAKLPPMLPAALQAYQVRQQAIAKGDLSWDPVQLCKPPGVTRSYLENSWPFEIVQTSDRVDFLFQWNRMVRTVPMQAAQGAFIGPFYYGQSVGQWQADALVVDLVGLNDDVYLDPSGLPQSEQLHVVETFKLADEGKSLNLTLRVEDPLSYSEPWQSKLQFVRRPLGSIAEDDCVVRLNLEKRYPVLPAKLYPR
jgi:hypothetical protein